MSVPQTREIRKGREQLVRYLAVAVAVVLAALGFVAAVAPDTAIAISRKLVSPIGIYAAAALRSGIGIALLLIARGSRAPTILRIMGVVSLIAGITFPILGVDNAKARIEWEAAHLMFLRLEGVMFVWTGFIVYKIAKPQKAGCSTTPSNTSLERTREG
jgi:hypothetical protein